MRKSNISDGSYFPAALSGKRNCECANLPRRLEGGTERSCWSRKLRCLPVRHPWCRVLYLALKDSFVPVVVANGR